MWPLEYGFVSVERGAVLKLYRTIRKQSTEKRSKTLLITRDKLKDRICNHKWWNPLDSYKPFQYFLVYLGNHAKFQPYFKHRLYLNSV